MRRLKLKTKLFALAAIAASSGAQAQFNDLFLFGDSYTDTGAYVTLTNGLTAGAYLARDLGINLVTSKSADPGTSGVNFAESGARIAQGPTAPATQPRSLTQQVAEFQAYLQAGTLTFNPSTSLFFLLGGLNDHTSPDGPLSAATFQQVATLYSLGARDFEIALLPTLVPAFTDSANNVNPLMESIVPQLQALYPDAHIQLSNWGPDYDNVMRNAASYGITNTTDACLGNKACTDPDKYFYYYNSHPSNYVHQIVGNELYTEAETMFSAITAVPEPSTYALLAVGLVGLAAVSRRRQARRM